MDLQIRADETFDAMAPYIEERFPSDGPEWVNILDGLHRKWKYRLWQRKLLGWMPDSSTLPAFLRGKRSQDYVRASYENTWSTHDWPSLTSHPKGSHTSLIEWKDQGYKVRRGGLARAHLLVCLHILQKLRPRSILEVGCGNGRNLFALSGHLPETQWYGIDLTQAGIDKAHSVQRDNSLPKQLIEYSPLPLPNLTSFQQIQFRQGDAKALPYDDSSFDLVFTHLSLEQMESIRDSAISEIARVARHFTIMVEPFAEFNCDQLRLNYVRAKDYFSLPFSDLTHYGITPITTFNEFPQQVTLGAGVVLGQISKNA